MITKIKKIIAILATTSVSGCILLNYPVGTFDIKLSAKAANGGVVIDETTFPHPRFCKYVGDNFDLNNDGFLSANEIDNVVSIDIENSGISDLSGIEYFTNLSELNCFDNRLKTLDLSNNNLLTYLECSINELKSLDLSNATQLHYLRCDANQLTNLDVSDATSLSELRCSGNELTSLDLCKNTELSVLYCGNNELTNLDLSNSNFLTYLDCCRNNLINLDVSNATKLTNLICYENQLTSLDLSANISLSELNCDNNKLTSLNLSKNTSLIDLNCDTNQLTSLDLSKNTSLNGLNCDNNQLTSLDVSNLKWLEVLSCYDNQLTSLDVNNLKWLVVLSCYDNQLTNLDISNNRELVALFCGNNQLTNLDLSNNTSLNSLNCDNNQLTSLDLSNNIALRGFGCSGNQLTVLDLSNNKELYDFGCRNNYLTTLDLSNNPKLEYLYCSGNRLTCLDLTNNTSQYLRVECVDNVYEINLIGNTFDLSTLPNGFDITKTSDWKNASIDGNTLKFHGYNSNDGKITYRYDHVNGGDSMFTLVVVPTQLEENMVQKIEAQTYTGKAVKPVEIFHNDYKLIEDKDYAITYENNINAGTASYTITGSDLFDNRTGYYTGELTGTFTIEKATPEITPVIPEIEYYTGAELPEITAKSEIDGNIKWATELVNGLNEGENELEWQFTPNDSNNYNVVTGTIIVTAQTAATTIQPSGETTIDIEKIENPEEGDELFVEAGSVQAVFDYNAMIEIEHNHGNKEIKFSYKVVEKEEIEENEAIKEAIEDSDQLFKFDLSDSNGNKVKFNSDSNNGIVTITIPYTKPVSANEVKVYYISPTGEKIDMNGKYDPSTKTITFDTTHFSYYSIVAEYEKETETTTTSTTTTTTTTTTTETTTSTTATSTTTPPTTTTVTTTTLPETGYSVIYNYIILAAAAMVIFGIYTILKNREEA